MSRPLPRYHGRLNVRGHRGLAFERIYGTEMPAAMKRSPFAILSLLRQFASMHRMIHAVRAPRLQSYHAYLQHVFEHSDVLTNLQQENMRKRLAALPGGSALCHGDYHPGNILVSDNGPIPIDWATAKRGDPLADVARTYVLLLIGGAAEDGSAVASRVYRLARTCFAKAYLRRYFGNRQDGRARMRRWIPVFAALKRLDDVPQEKEMLHAMMEGDFALAN